MPGKQDHLDIPVVHHRTDVLIIGGGAAGTMAAFECAEAGVAVIQVTKGRATSGTTTVARGGFAAAMGEDDSPELHLQDILRHGGELIDPELARVWVYDIVDVVHDLESWGAEFVRGADGRLDLKSFPSHSRNRACHHYDTTGNMITKVLSKKLRADSRIGKHSITAIVDLLKQDGRVVGAWGVDYRNGALVIYHAQQIILCTGGGSGLFYVNDNPPQVTGDGYVLGFRAGVPLLGIEMIDFQAMCCSPKELFGFAPHPTGFINAGAVFRNQEGEEFLKRYFPETAEQSTRSEVILAMAKEIHSGRATPTGGIFMDATKVPMEVIQKQIPHVYKTCLHRGIDITKTPLEVAPGSHTWLGGLKVDVDGKTPVAGLFAAGETAGGIHGGNRIGGSALSASLVYGRRAGRKAAALVKEIGSQFGPTKRRRYPRIRTCMACGPHASRQRPFAIRRADELPHAGAQQARSDPRGTNAQGGPGRVRARRARGRADHAARRKSAKLRQCAGRGAGERALRAQSRFARAYPGERRARAHGKPRCAFPARPPGHR